MSAAAGLPAAGAAVARPVLVTLVTDSGTVQSGPRGNARVRVVRSGERMRVSAGPGLGPVRRVRVSFAAAPGERWLGFGERSDAVARSSGVVENYVSEGPYASASDYNAVAGTIPPWGLRRSRDATYFPIPWLVSTLSYGVLVTDDETSRFRLGAPHGWDVEVDAPSATLRLVAGRSIADVVGRMSASVGRQPAPTAPWVFGPWFQTGHPNVVPGEQRFVDILRRADAPVSVAETQLRYLPCLVNRRVTATERARAAAFHAAGLANVSYMQSAVCTDTDVFAGGVPRNAFLRRADGTPYAFGAYADGAKRDLAYVDFSQPAGVVLWQSIADENFADGHDGFMEDFGEYAPPDAVDAEGNTGSALHNAYPRRYHAAGQAWSRRQSRPVTRFVRSGWRASARNSPIVWGGDPTTGWGFDGLQSAVREALTMGLSGVSTWGSDIGGFFTLGPERLTPELLARWIQFGSVSGVMRTKAGGIGADQDKRPQIWERPTLAVWRRYAKLRTQLYPYLVAADDDYRRTGVPIMRSLAFENPRLANVEDAFGFGADLLAAPVLRPGERTRTVTLPGGRWVDLWRSARYVPGDGSLRLGATRQRSGRVTVPAPLDQLPLFVRAGAVLPLLAPDVDTLADYGDQKYGGRPGLVKLRDRRTELRLLAFPRGTSASRFDSDGAVRSREAGRSWTLTLRASTARRVRLQASLRTLRHPFRPCRVSGVRSWSYDRRSGVLRATFSGRTARVVVQGC